MCQMQYDTVLTDIKTISIRKTLGSPNQTKRASSINGIPNLVQKLGGK